MRALTHSFTRFAAITLTPLAYIALTASIAAILAYGIHLATLGTLNFSLVVSRGAQVVLLLTLIPLARWLHLGRTEFGLPENALTGVRQLLVGLSIGSAILGLHVACMLWLRVFKPTPDMQPTLADLSRAVPSALASGLLVAIMEETIFRGVMLSMLLRCTRPVVAAAITAAYYAILHFVKNDLRPAGTNVRWYSGFAILADGVDYLVTETNADALVALFLAGMLLALIRSLRADSLVLCVGIHTGWVLVIKLARRYTNPDPHLPLFVLVSPYDQVIGYGAAGWIVLPLLLLLFHAWRNRRSHRSE